MDGCDYFLIQIKVWKQCKPKQTGLVFVANHRLRRSLCKWCIQNIVHYPENNTSSKKVEITKSEKVI